MSAESEPCCEQSPLLPGMSMCNPLLDDPTFSQIVEDCENAIRVGIYPQRIKQGSSGSYFAKNYEGVGARNTHGLAQLIPFLKICGRAVDVWNLYSFATCAHPKQLLGDKKLY